MAEEKKRYSDEELEEFRDIINEKLRLNVSYFCSLYSDYDKITVDKSMGGGYQGTPYGATETYSRTNHVIGVGLDYKF